MLRDTAPWGGPPSSGAPNPRSVLPTVSLDLTPLPGAPSGLTWPPLPSSACLAETLSNSLMCHHLGPGTEAEAPLPGLLARPQLPEAPARREDHPHSPHPARSSRLRLQAGPPPFPSRPRGQGLGCAASAGKHTLPTPGLPASALLFCQTPGQNPDGRRQTVPCCASRGLRGGAAQGGASPLDLVQAAWSPPPPPGHQSEVPGKNAHIWNLTGESAKGRARRGTGP